MPWALTAPILGLGAVAVTHVVYEAEGWGVGELVADRGRVLWHELPWPRACGDGRQADGGFARDVVALVQAFLGGREGAAALAEVPVDLEYETPFLARCADALRAVPAGEVVTYGELAALAGAPGAARAAGSFCARNRLGLFVPCHRVVGADGLGSYGTLGLAYKRRLLELEGAL
jgi:methylated-DNA-[protein]-cysteine S-methyltransferase